MVPGGPPAWGVASLAPQPRLRLLGHCPHPSSPVLPPTDTRPRGSLGGCARWGGRYFLLPGRSRSPGRASRGSPSQDLPAGTTSCKRHRGRRTSHPASHPGARWLVARWPPPCTHPTKGQRPPPGAERAPLSEVCGRPSLEGGACVKGTVPAAPPEGDGLSRKEDRGQASAPAPDPAGPPPPGLTSENTRGSGLGSM